MDSYMLAAGIRPPETQRSWMPQLIMANPATSSPRATPSRTLFWRFQARMETAREPSRMIQDHRLGCSRL